MLHLKHRWNAMVGRCCECFSKREHRHARVNWLKSNFYSSLFRFDKRASVTQCHRNKFSYFNARHSEASCSFVPSNERSATLQCASEFSQFSNLPIQKSPRRTQCARSSVDNKNKTPLASYFIWLWPTVLLSASSSLFTSLFIWLSWQIMELCWCDGHKSGNIMVIVLIILERTQLRNTLNVANILRFPAKRTQ